ncbi:glycosyltransferase [Amycolatopsis sp., V23-08]|uniref:Glycosyltransferase n=1 Tax=Amycolatopsis heterodermiae TaxID=3110235 RepID=A0ABU5R9R7_9PSEU|nr:glycosyltransferase [Amycolatopsis sp., V23-08]MEA5362534.1 glycosyltransferase [Amycolatopsis sp., V23-08]
MLVTVLAAGLAGDVHPLAALARGLRDAGHTVRFATHRHWRSVATQTGLDYAELAGDPRAVVTDESFLRVLEAERRPDRLAAAAVSAVRSLARRVEWQSNTGLRAVIQLARWYDEALMNDVWSACEGAEAVIYGAPLAYHGYYAARALGVPGVAAFLQTGHPLDHSVPGRRFLGQQIIWQIFRESITRWQRQTGQRTAPFLGPFPRWHEERLPIVYGLSPSVLPEPDAVGGDRHVAGYWFLDSALGTSLPAHVRDFLAAGPPPVYFTFGSLATSHPERLTHVINAALAVTGDRAIIATAWGGIGPTPDTDSVLCVEELPLDLVFPHVRAVVHHGGMMVTAEGLRAGRPTVLVPTVFDQFDWGNRIAELGVGPRPLGRKELTPMRLAGALTATREPEMVRAAAELGTRIGAERGVDHMVKVLDRVLTSGRDVRWRKS